MNFDKLINEVKGKLKKDDQITLPNSSEIWTVGDSNGDYYSITNNNTGVEGQLSKYRTAEVKRVPVLEYMTPDDKSSEIKRYKEKIKTIKGKMKKYKANSKKGSKYQELLKDLERTQMALDLCSKQTPRMSIY